MDFGIVKILGGDSHTPPRRSWHGAYMSPELIRGEVADHRSDIYSWALRSTKCSADARLRS
jgi:serine/threonine protein kinase